MIKGPKDVFILLLAAVCLGISLVFLPFSEMNFTANFPDWLAGPMNHLGVTKFFSHLSHHPFGLKTAGIPWFCTDPNNLLPSSNRSETNMGDYAYSYFLFIAITAAAIAIILIGKEDNSEKTVLEVKK